MQEVESVLKSRESAFLLSGTKVKQIDHSSCTVIV